ncbi:hypothetical protein OTU49_002959 [Cherax quadricarinatus]|uniref:EGF-like domain-containing protein n=2 Tax=Cherax quadricarinatus TaxID=27406 RepID=A0AAW0XML4_CHEQU|nr:uncharacterized protein LOC128693925 isoform X2 [Cherax quadricarinatus]
MQLGEGSRQVGQPCWSHVQCLRSQQHSHCTALVCTCDSGFQQYGERCTRNLLGLQQWEMLLIALFVTLLFLAVFLGCIYFLVSRLARRYRQTLPAGELVPGSFQDSSPSSKRGSIEDTSIKSIRIAETQLVTGAMESKMVEQMALTDFQTMKMGSSLGSAADTSSLSGQSSSGGSRSSRGWQSISTEQELDNYIPSWRYYRVPTASRSAGRVYRPLLLKTSTFSESDESP